MLKQFQKRFIIAVMSAFSVVVVLIIIGINIVNAVQMKRSQDDVIENIHAYNDLVDNLSEGEEMPIYELFWEEDENREFTTRFFVVHCDKEGNVTVFGSDYISSVDEEAAEAYTKAVLGKGKEKGNYGDYRYTVIDSKEELVLIFLNIADANQYEKNLLMISVLIGMGSLLAVFVLVLLFSKPAIKPYMKNVEKQKRFITDASHELKTPITSIAMSADIAAMEHGSDEWIDNIQKQTDRLRRLVNELIFLSRLDEEVPIPQKTRFSISETVWEITEPFSRMAQVQGKQFCQEIEDAVYLMGDRDSIGQMLSILLDNALKYSDEKGEIRIKLFEKRGKIIIELYNSCELQDGIEWDRLFDRFYRPDDSRSTCVGGFGIGLSIAKRIVTLHGGRICVSPVEKRGLLFQVIF